MTYQFEAYDVLQVLKGDQWLDFSTLRTEAEGRQAVALVNSGMWDGRPMSFRIVGNTCHRIVKLVR